jgi:hypothetical protein
VRSLIWAVCAGLTSFFAFQLAFAQSTERLTPREEMKQQFKRGLAGPRLELEDRPSATAYDFYVDRLSAVRSRLNLSAGQAVFWQDYESKVVLLLEDVKRAKAVRAGGTAVQRIGQAVGIAQSRYTGMEDIFESAKRLYSVLQDDQKRIADDLLPTTVPQFD